MKGQKDLQQKYMQIQMIDGQINQLQQQHKMLDDQVMEVMVIKQSLDDFLETKTGSEVLTQVSPGIFAKTELKDNKDLIVNVGSNIAVKKTVPETKKMMEKQLSEIKEAQVNVMLNITQLTNQALMLEKDLSNQ